MGSRSVTAVLATLIALGTSMALMAAPANAGGGRAAAPPPVPASRGDYHQLVNSVSGKCADVSDKSKNPGALIHQWDCANEDHQLWLARPAGDGYVLYQNLNSGLCLHVQNDTAKAGTPLDQQSCRVLTSTRWKWLPADDIGHQVLKSGLGNFCMALQTYSARNGWPIVINDCATTSGQMWRID